MRMWMVAPQLLCRQHLLGEHVETHMLLGTLKRGTSVEGYIRDNLFEPRSLYDRHDELAEELLRRGYRHQSPMSRELEISLDGVIDRKLASEELFRRCSRCLSRQTSELKLN